MNYKIIPCQKSELNELRTLIKDTFLHTYAHLNTEESMRNYVKNNFAESHINKEFSNPNSFFFVLKSENEICGYTKLNIESAQTESRGNEALEIERIYLKEASKGKGLGRMLIHHSVEMAKEKGKKSIWLGVWEKNLNAIAFYEKCGLEICGKHDFVLGEEVQTDFIMEMKIS